MSKPAQAIAKVAQTLTPDAIPAPWVSAFDAVLGALESRARGNADVQAVVTAVRGLMPPQQINQPKENKDAPPNPAP